MAAAVALTGVVAWMTFNAAVTTDASGAITGMTAFGQSIFSGPAVIVLFLATLGLVFFISFRIQTLSFPTAITLFMVYAGLLGVMLSSVFLAYTGASITRVFFISAASFGALSLYGYTTQRDLSGMGSFLIMGLFGVIIASVVNLFLKSSGLEFVISIVGVLVFAGLTAWDTQKIKEMYDVNDDGTVSGRKAVMGALSLYLDFINLFLMLLRLVGDRR
jgi:FtsH-binding integral membrane protein